MNNQADSLSACLARYTACDPTSSYEGKTADAYRLADEVLGLLEACRDALPHIPGHSKHARDMLIDALQKFEATL